MSGLFKGTSVFLSNFSAFLCSPTSWALINAKFVHYRTSICQFSKIQKASILAHLALRLSLSFDSIEEYAHFWGSLFENHFLMLTFECHIVCSSWRFSEIQWTLVNSVLRSVSQHSHGGTEPQAFDLERCNHFKLLSGDYWFAAVVL